MSMKLIPVCHSFPRFSSHSPLLPSFWYYNRSFQFCGIDIADKEDTQARYDEDTELHEANWHIGYLVQIVIRL